MSAMAVPKNAATFIEIFTVQTYFEKKWMVVENSMVHIKLHFTRWNGYDRGILLLIIICIYLLALKTLRPRNLI